MIGDSIPEEGEEQVVIIRANKEGLSVCSGIRDEMFQGGVCVLTVAQDLCLL